LESWERGPDLEINHATAKTRIEIIRKTRREAGQGIDPVKRRDIKSIAPTMKMNGVDQKIEERPDLKETIEISETIVKLEILKKQGNLEENFSEEAVEEVLVEVGATPRQLLWELSHLQAAAIITLIL